VADLLIKNLKRTKKQLQKDGQAEEAARYDFFPTTYQLPSEYAVRSRPSLRPLKSLGVEF
jgi:hypothetical protein